MSTRTIHTLKSINEAQQDIIDRQTQKIGRLEEVVQQHEAARIIEVDRLANAQARMADILAREEALKVRVDEYQKQVEDLQDKLAKLALAHKINTETLAVFATPVVKVLSQADQEALTRGDYVDVSSPPGTGDL
jgi:chromosome segregation ATPase